MQHKIGTSYVIESLPEHDDVKHTLLDTIASMETEAIDLPVHTFPVDDIKQGRDVISNADYFVDLDERPYMDVLLEQTSFIQTMTNVFNDLGFTDAKIGTFWFQQYYQNDNHAWHTHGECNWAIVYYVELPDGAPPTVLYDLHTEEIIRPAVEEGDMIVFPSNTPHTSPPNEVDDRKTIIAMNVVCTDCHNIAEPGQRP